MKINQQKLSNSKDERKEYKPSVPLRKYQSSKKQITESQEERREGGVETSLQSYNDKTSKIQ